MNTEWKDDYAFLREARESLVSDYALLGQRLEEAIRANNALRDRNEALEKGPNAELRKELEEARSGVIAFQRVQAGLEEAIRANNALRDRNEALEKGPNAELRKELEEARSGVIAFQRVQADLEEARRLNSSLTESLQASNEQISALKKAGKGSQEAEARLKAAFAAKLSEIDAETVSLRARLAKADAKVEKLTQELEAAYAATAKPHAAKKNDPGKDPWARRLSPKS